MGWPEEPNLWATRHDQLDLKQPLTTLSAAAATSRPSYEASGPDKIKRQSTKTDIDAKYVQRSGIRRTTRYKGYRNLHRFHGLGMICKSIENFMGESIARHARQDIVAI